MNYEYPNAYFKRSDPTVDVLCGFEIPPGFWSRKHEYKFAMLNCPPVGTTADMGAGWHYRPLHDWLSQATDFCYAVDHHVEILDLPPMQKGAFVVADFAEPIDAIPAASLDRIFCISVLEELIDYEKALAEFKRLLKDDGRMVITMDAPYNPARPAHDKYKGVNLAEFEQAMERVGLEYDGAVNRDMPEDALFNEDFNLAVWRCILKKKEGK